MFAHVVLHTKPVMHLYSLISCPHCDHTPHLLKSGDWVNKLPKDLTYTTSKERGHLICLIQTGFAILQQHLEMKCKTYSETSLPLLQFSARFN